MTELRLVYPSRAKGRWSNFTGVVPYAISSFGKLIG